MVELDVEFLLNYEVLDAKGADFIFNIHAARTLHQSVDHEQFTLNQNIWHDVETDPVYGARFVRLHAQPGPLNVAYRALVTLQHHRAEPDLLEEVPMRALPLSVMPYVYPSRYCESDRLFSLAMREFGGLWQGYSRVLAIQHWIQDKVAFVSNTSNGNTSALDTLIDRRGVCRDFAHLMIALCRALNIPARIATGTDYGASESLGPPDFHAYVEVYLGNRWYLFDPSGTGIPMGFIRMGTGRDAADVAFATLFGQVNTNAPIVRTTARQGPGLQMPSHGREALSTTAMVTA